MLPPDGRARLGRWQCPEPAGSIGVRPEWDAVVLIYRSWSWGGSDWKSVERRVPITWTACHLGGRRPWFICPCGRRVAVLYGAGELFACRHCCGLAYESQQEPVGQRGLGRAQKIRMQLGGCQSMFEPFPVKPKGMHWRTYDRLRCAHDAADARFVMGMMRFVDRVQRRAPSSGRR